MIAQPDIAERVYAGVLGKAIGVYLGRPVEGWPYDQIRSRFGQLDSYVNDSLGVPLIVADDDISGTFVFGRAVEDLRGEPTAAQVGDTWLNYVIEDRTILWWGGLGRSTEHTAFINLKRGIPAPRSGSITQNGSMLAEQIGAQIFSDAFALMCPGDPERAVRLTRAAASVSHDGVALEAAGFLAAMRALAFEERDLNSLIQTGSSWVGDPVVRRLIDDVVTACEQATDWREIRTWVDEHHGYHRHPGPCHALSNLAMSLGALLGGGDDFGRAVMIASSVGFDTDSNAGTVGCVNGVRLGLAAIPADLREPVADRMIVVSADGGEAVTDAVLEARRILACGAALRGEPAPARLPRFNFEFDGSRQGFAPCPFAGVEGAEISSTSSGLRVTGIDGAAISTQTFLGPEDTATNFSTLASPTLYPGQRVDVALEAPNGATVAPYVVHLVAGAPRITAGDPTHVAAGQGTISWVVPDLGNYLPCRVGIRIDGEADVTIGSLDWFGAPELFGQSGMLLESIWETRPDPIRAWVSSAKNFEADFAATFSVSHPDPMGVATIGSRDWADYTVAADIEPSLHEVAGLVARARGHRRFLALTLAGGDRIQLIDQRDSERVVLAQAALDYELNRRYRLALRCEGGRLTGEVDGTAVLIAEARGPVLGGAAGFIVETGAFQASNFTIATTKKGNN
ncbi:ADP-ribosylglycohydrolase family protein [Tessaracoccus lapidicaptus]|uniref:ADP-ribosylglycohydrolase family protein n=1 Tax=Tessaracoccus lapidicaptus TaxID=1427523 RepID=UPI003341C948